MTGYFSPNAAGQASAKANRRRSALAGAWRFGPAMVSVSALIWAAPALAQSTTGTTISSGTNTPQKTSTTGDLTIDNGGAITPSSGAAVTIDSNNAVSNNGAITFNNKNNVTGILATGPFTGAINNTGTLTVSDDSQPSTDDNGIPHGPFANGDNRVGIRIMGPDPNATYTGDVINSATGVMTIKGNGVNPGDSAGISIEMNLAGQLSNLGAISAAGTNVIGIRTTGSVSGPVNLSGTISAAGQGAQAVNLGGDIGGALNISGDISSTGYRFTTRPTDSTFLSKLKPDDLLQGGTAVTVSGNVGGGILVDSVTSTDSTGVVTVSSAAISNAAGAPAMVIGNATRNVTIGNVGTDGYGIEIKGSVTGAGVYDNIANTAMRIGIAGGGTVNTTGGISIAGTVSSSAYAASSTAIEMNQVIAPILRVDGAISAQMNSDAAGAASTAIVISAGSNVQELQNANSIIATVAGQTANVAGVIDKSGTLSEVENIGIITTSRTLNTTGAPVTGTAVALDLSHNTTGVHLGQSAEPGAALTPSITGDVLLGSGSDRVEILAGSLTGKLDLGAGANSLTIDNGATVRGDLDAVGGSVALSVNKGSLAILDASQLKAPSLNLGSGATLVVTADPKLGQATSFDVAGTATIASGAQIGVRLASILPTSATYTLVHATTLNSSAADSSLLVASPFLYNTSLQTNAAEGTITATLSRKSAAELALPSTTANAYEPLIAAIGRDAGLEGALLAQTTRDGVLALYNQMLPNHQASIFNTVAASIESFSKPLDARQDPKGGGFWMQETNAGVFKDGSTDDPGYKAWSFGVVAGYEVPRTPLGILGATFGVSTNQIYADQAVTGQDLHATLVDAGVYWRVTKGGFSANLRFGGDYIKVSSTRVIDVLGGDGLAVSRTANGDWSAVGFNAHAMASYETHFGNVYVRPLVSADYLRLAEGSYTETGGGDGMNLAVASRTSSRLTAFGGVAVGALYGADRSWGPEALLGYRTVASENLGVTTARFAAGGDPFTLRSDDISGSGAAVHLALRGENGSGGFAVEAGAENRDSLSIYDLRLTGHVQF